MTEPITNEAQITASWLTERLRQNGHLAQGEVRGLGIQSFKTLFSNMYRLEISYSNDAAPMLPSKLLLKSPFPDNEAALKMGQDEAAIYRALTKAMPDPPVARCFDAVSSRHSLQSHLLLEDLSDSHFQPELPVPPSARHCELCVETLAEFHAFWWNHPALGTEVGQLFDKATAQRVEGQLRNALSGFIDFLGDCLSTERRKFCENALAFLPAFWERRLMSCERNTLIHGDAHLWNFMHPKDTSQGRAYLIDLATTNRIRPPTNDLAYMMALQWFPARRERMEQKLLRHYHEALLSYGVKDYSWEDCWLDYRHSVVTHLLTPVSQWDSRQIPAMVWWNNFERIAEAYRDLNCDELLG